MEKRSVSETKLVVNAKTLYYHCCSDDYAERNAAYQQLGGFLVRILLSRLRTKSHLAALAEECSQQALFVIWQKLDEGRGPERPEWFLTWSASIAIHKLLDELRKRGKYRLESLDEDESGVWQSPDRNAVAPEECVLTKETRQELFSAIQQHPRLSEDAKIVLLYGFLLERNDEELAALLGKAQATVRVLRFRGLHALRNDHIFMSKLNR